MFPSFSPFDARDCVCRDTKDTGYFLTAPWVCSDSHYLGISQFRKWTMFSKTMSLLLDHILGIILSGSAVKVHRIYTALAVTFMEYIKSFWNRTIVNLPRNTMGTGHFPIRIPDVPISFCASHPEPATTVRFWHNKVFESAFKFLFTPSCRSVNPHPFGFTFDASKGPMDNLCKFFSTAMGIKFAKSFDLFWHPAINSTNPHLLSLMADRIKRSMEHGRERLFGFGREIFAKDFFIGFRPHGKFIISKSFILST